MRAKSASCSDRPGFGGDLSWKDDLHAKQCPRELQERRRGLANIAGGRSPYHLHAVSINAAWERGAVLCSKSQARSGASVARLGRKYAGDAAGGHQGFTASRCRPGGEYMARNHLRLLALATVFFSVLLSVSNVGTANASRGGQGPQLFVGKKAGTVIRGHRPPGRRRVQVEDSACANPALSPNTPQCAAGGRATVPAGSGTAITWV